MLVTKRGDSHSPIETLSCDGIKIAVYDSFYVVAPNSVIYEGKLMQHVSDWVQAILEMAKTKRWPTSDEPQFKRGTRGHRVQQNIFTTVHSSPIGKLARLVGSHRHGAKVGFDSRLGPHTSPVWSLIIQVHCLT